MSLCQSCSQHAQKSQSPSTLCAHTYPNIYCCGSHVLALSGKQCCSQQRGALGKLLTDDAWSCQAVELLLQFEMYKSNSRCVNLVQVLVHLALVHLSLSASPGNLLTRLLLHTHVVLLCRSYTNLTFILTFIRDYHDLGYARAALG